MIFHSPRVDYEVVSVKGNFEVNDCYLARCSGGNDGSLYLLILIREHETVRKFLDILRLSSIKEEESPIVECFSVKEDYVVVFPYRTERPFDSFFVGDAYTLAQCETMSSNLILSCITSNIPYPLLYLILTQRKINITRDDNVYLSYDIDLEGLDEYKSERDCASECALLVLDILKEKSNEKNVSYELLKRKTANRSYSFFTEIYRDIMIASTSMKKKGIIVKIKSFFYRNADRIFGIIFWISLILMIVALVLLLTHFVWGDIPFLRIFFNSFKNIGTESLLQ